MPRITGTYQTTRTADEDVRAFLPLPLPPTNPPLALTPAIQAAHQAAMISLGQLAVAAHMVPSADWFLYGFVRKEALITSQIEGTQATLRDVLTFEAGEKPQRPDDVREVCNYLDALAYARRQIARPKGLPLSIRLLCEAHRRLMQGARGHDKHPGQIRRTQNWIGGTRPGNALFVPPPPQAVPAALANLEKYLHANDAKDPLPPLIRAGLAHVQFETIHPFLDGNGRIGRLLVALLMEHWQLLPQPLLYLSVAFKRHRADYYYRLDSVRTDGDWENWTRFFLDCVRESADDGVQAAQRLAQQIITDRRKLLTKQKPSKTSGGGAVTAAAMQLFELLPRHPIITLPRALKLLHVSKPTIAKALAHLHHAGILHETTGKKRDRVYAYHHYLQVLTQDT